MFICEELPEQVEFLGILALVDLAGLRHHRLANQVHVKRHLSAWRIRRFGATLRRSSELLTTPLTQVILALCTMKEVIAAVSGRLLAVGKCRLCGRLLAGAQARSATNVAVGAHHGSLGVSLREARVALQHVPLLALEPLGAGSVRGSMIESGQGQQGQRTELVDVLSVRRGGACPQLLKRLDPHLERPIESRDRKVEYCVLIQHGWPGERHLHIDVLGLRRGRLTDSEVDGESFGVDREPHGLARPPLAAGAASAISSVVTPPSAVSSPAKLALCGAQLDRLGQEHGAQVLSRPIGGCDVLGREDDAHIGTIAVKVAIMLFTLEIDLPDP